MTRLEYMLCIMAARVRKGGNKNKLANDILSLASASHDYEPIKYQYPENGIESPEDRLAELHAEFQRKYDRLLSRNMHPAD